MGMPKTQFSLRRLLLLITLCAVLSLIPVLSGQSQIWATGLLVGLLAAAVLLAVNAALYALVGLLRRAWSRKKGSNTASV
jgi:hypothetical protein